MSSKRKQQYDAILALLLLAFLANAFCSSYLSGTQTVESGCNVANSFAAATRLAAHNANAAAYNAYVAAYAAKAELEQQQAQAAQIAQMQSAAASKLKSSGVLTDGTYRYTWYSSNVLHHCRTAEWNAFADGMYRDTEGYIVVASSYYANGTVLNTSLLGPCKVYDSGCASGTLDVYVNW